MKKFRPGVRLRHVLDGLAGKPCPRVLFICLGNICRSAAAQTMLETLAEARGADIGVDSAGTYGGHAGQMADPRMRRHAARRGLDITHRARQVRESDFDRFDLIVAMDDANYDDLRRMAPTLEGEGKIVRMADFFSQPASLDYVPDPYYSGAEGFELVLDLLEDACSNLLDSLR